MLALGAQNWSNGARARARQAAPKRSKGLRLRPGAQNCSNAARARGIGTILCARAQPQTLGTFGGGLPRARARAIGPILCAERQHRAAFKGGLYKGAFNGGFQKPLKSLKKGPQKGPLKGGFKKAFEGGFNRALRGLKGPSSAPLGPKSPSVCL